MNPLAHLDDDALLASLRSLIQSHRRVTSNIVAHLGEVDDRRIHVARGYSSLFEYCMKELGFSEDEAYRRIELARMARQFPAMLGLLEAGTVSLSALALLKHHIEPSNAGELLTLVSGVSVRLAKERLAARFPLPHVANGVRKLPTPVQAPIQNSPGASPELSGTSSTGGHPAMNPRASVDASEREAAPGQEALRLAPASTDSMRIAPSVAASTRASLEPLGEDRFLVKVTLTRATRDKLELARDLMRHRNPDGRLDAVLEAALDALIDDFEKRRFGKARHPRKAPTELPSSASRSIPRASRRVAVGRDGMRCAFVSHDGHRCESRAFLEFDHLTPIGKGGGPESSNIRVLCRAHNRLERSGRMVGITWKRRSRRRNGRARSRGNGRGLRRSTRGLLPGTSPKPPRFRDIAGE
jgi:hypothetical protein